MRILPLGGAHEIGASSTIVEFGAYRFLIDAGIRIGASGGEQLPDLARIKEEAGPINAIMLTHAHMDHSGALPLVHLAYPDVPIYMTPATFAVLRILFSDSQRQMEERYQLDGEIPLYPTSAMDSCMGRIRPVPFDYPLRLSGGEVAATFYPAGHILGASAIHLQGRSGSLLLSGDISVTDQRTVPGMLAPQIRPDVVMIESTYGDRLHAHRPTQEANLVRTVHTILSSGGKVIIPAFAVGRAQEVILILQSAINKGQLPPYPIFVDGMVQSVCDTYSRFPTYLQQHLRHSVQRGNNPFFPAGGSIHRVRSQAQRERIIEGPPCCIIASSGMMTGGPSAFYAAALAHDARNLIAITGYQDEEAPGRRLIELVEAPAEQRRLRIDDRDVQVACQVEKYALSAHADSGEIAGLVGGLNPAQGVVLVHGDGDARESLAQTIDHSVHCDIFLPQNGEVLRFKPPRQVFYPPTSTMQVSLASPKQPLDATGISHLHQALWSESGARGLYRVVDLYARWSGPDLTPSIEEVTALHQLLLAHPQFFHPDPRRPQLFRLTSPQAQQKRPRLSQAQGRVEMNRALQIVTEILPEESGLYKKGARREEYILLLFFSFPQKAQTRYAEHLDAIAQQTGWKVQINEMPHHAALEESARRLLPHGWQPQRNPSIVHEEQRVSLRVFCPSPSSEEADTSTLQNIQHAFFDETGYHLTLHPQPLPTSTEELPLETASTHPHDPTTDLSATSAHQQLSSTNLSTTSAHQQLSSSPHAAQPPSDTSSQNPIPPTSQDISSQNTVHPTSQDTSSQSPIPPTSQDMSSQSPIPPTSQDTSSQSPILPLASAFSEERISASNKPLEINLAYQRIEEAFARCPHRPYKKSKKGDKIVLSFLSPYVGERYAQQVERLAQNIGWSIQINPEPNEYGIKQEVRALLPKSWGLAKEPGIHKRTRLVRVQVPRTPETMEIQQVAEQVYERTGFYLEVRRA